MSSTSSSWRSGRLSTVAGLGLLAGVRLGLLDVDLAVLGRTRPGCGGPTRAGARRTRARCCASTRNRSSPSGVGSNTVSPCSTALIAGWARVVGVDVPLVGQPGLDHHAGAVAVRAPRGGSSRSPRSQAQLLHRRGRRSPCGRRSGPCRRSRPGRRGRCSVRRRGVQDVDQRQVVALADLEVVEVVGGRDLHRARALFRVGVVVGDDRDAGGRRWAGARPCRPGRLVAASSSGMHGHGRCRPAWSRAGWWRRRSRGLRGRRPADRRSASSAPSTSRCSTSRSEMAVWNCGSQFTSRLSR